VSPQQGSGTDFANQRLSLTIGEFAGIIGQDATNVVIAFAMGSRLGDFDSEKSHALTKLSELRSKGVIEHGTASMYVHNIELLQDMLRKYQRQAS
jgi:hypothetical protein